MKNFTTSRIDYQLLQNLFLYNLIFKNISFGSNGGAIFINQISISFYCSFCTFQNCISTSYGGGICIHNLKSININFTCFYKCKAFRCPGFIFWITSYSIESTYFNNSVECHSEISDHVSGLAGYTLKSTQNNFTNQCSTSYSAGIFFGTSKSEEVSNYGIISNSNGPSFIGLGNSNSAHPILNNYNLINNTCTIAWIEIHSYNSILTLNNCFFYKINKISTYYGLWGGAGIPQFNNCYFEFDSFNSISFINNNWNILTFSFYEIKEIEFKYCWEIYLISTSKIFQKQIFYFNIIFYLL